MKSVDISSLDRLELAAKEFLRAIGETKKIAFSGDMGAGKTTFIQALCKELGVDTIVNSPTFALINEYFTGQGESIYHFDLYRIEHEEEMYDFGYEDYFYSDDWCFVEWPERAEGLIPDDMLSAHIEVKEDGSRVISF